MSDLPLSECDREPIHIPGSIQPHGLLLVADAETLRLRQVAGDVEVRLGSSTWLDAPLSDLVGTSVAEAVRAGEACGFAGEVAGASGERFDAVVQRAGALVLVELEPAATDPAGPHAALLELERATTAFERCTSLAALLQQGAEEVRRITGYDRVMIYRFMDDGSGAVLAESRRDGLHSFLHHRFPASDIPRQARDLYLRNRIRVIPDIAYAPAPLRPQQPDLEPLDLSDCNLRSVSPVHLQYLRNMQVAASASMSIVKDDQLWGLVACHNETPRTVSFGARAVCRVLAATLAQQIKAKEEAEGYRDRIRLHGLVDDIVPLLVREGPLQEAAARHLDDVRRMFSADGVAILRGDDMLAGGSHPPPGALRDLADWAMQHSAGAVLATDRLSELYPRAAGYASAASALLAITIAREEPWVLMWFRAEQVEVINWAGNPHKDVAGPGGMLTPRASFEAWQETVRRRGRRWTIPESGAAARLRVAIQEVRRGRQLQELNRRLMESIAEKEMLIQQKQFLIGEVNHRVQNSLQLVSSFLALQARASDDRDLGAALDEAGRRLNAVALVHRRLYRGDQIEVVDAARYIEELCGELVESAGSEWAANLTLDLAPVMLPTDRAITMGLILTELVINVNKYAYGGAAGPLDILLRDEGGSFRLVVADRGGGRISENRGFGSRMIEALVTQLRGSFVRADNRPGLKVTLTAPVAAEPSGATRGGLPG